MLRTKEKVFSSPLTVVMAIHFDVLSITWLIASYYLHLACFSLLSCDLIATGCNICNISSYFICALELPNMEGKKYVWKLHETTKTKSPLHLIYRSVLDPICAVWQMIRLVIKPVIYKEILILVKVSRLWLDGSNGGCLTADGWSQSPVVILIGVSTVMDVVILIRVGWEIDEMGCDSRVSELAVRVEEEAGSCEDRTWNGHFTWQRSPTMSTHARLLADGRDTVSLIPALSFSLSVSQFSFLSSYACSHLMGFLNCVIILRWSFTDCGKCFWKQPY